MDFHTSEMSENCDVTVVTLGSGSHSIFFIVYSSEVATSSLFCQGTESI